jgi:hypothetical protein
VGLSEDSNPLAPRAEGARRGVNEILVGPTN